MDAVAIVQADHIMAYPCHKVTDRCWNKRAVASLGSDPNNNMLTPYDKYTVDCHLYFCGKPSSVSMGRDPCTLYHHPVNALCKLAVVEGQGWDIFFNIAFQLLHSFSLPFASTCNWICLPSLVYCLFHLSPPPTPMILLLLLLLLLVWYDNNNRNNSNIDVCTDLYLIIVIIILPCCFPYRIIIALMIVL